MPQIASTASTGLQELNNLGHLWETEQLGLPLARLWDVDVAGNNPATPQCWSSFSYRKASLLSGSWQLAIVSNTGINT